MAPTLPNGVVVPPEDGDVAISATGVQEMRVLGGSVDAQLATKAATAYVDAEVSSARYTRGRLQTGGDAFTLAPGVYTVGSLLDASQIANLPEQFPGTLIVEGNPGQGVKAIRFLPYQRDYSWETTAQNLSNGFMPWRKIGGAAAEAWAANSLHLARMHAHYGGPVDTGGLGAVAWRIDHGFANFRDKLLPRFRAAGIVPVITYNPRDWSRDENEGVTTSEVNSWVANGWVEISNHGATHADASGAAIEDYVAGSLAEIEAQLPAAKGKVFGFHVAGVGGSDAFDGFGGGSSAADWDTAMGRQILKSHAFGSGHMTGTTQRVLDGTVRNGLLHMATDSRPVSEITAQIDQAITDRTGFQIMTHPSLVDREGYNSSAMIQQIIDHIVAKRAAGQLAVLSPYQLMLADSTRPPVTVPDVTGLAARLAALEYDSGERDITGLLTNIVSGRLLVERTGPWVSLNFQELVTDFPSGGFASWNSVLPVGFRPSATSAYIDLPLAPRLATTTQGSVRISRFGEIRIYRLGGVATGVVHFKTHDAPPSTKPGIPA